MDCPGSYDYPFRIGTVKALTVVVINKSIYSGLVCHALEPVKVKHYPLTAQPDAIRAAARAQGFAERDAMAQEIGYAMPSEPPRRRQAPVSVRPRSFCLTHLSHFFTFFSYGHLHSIGR